MLLQRSFADERLFYPTPRHLGVRVPLPWRLFQWKCLRRNGIWNLERIGTSNSQSNLNTSSGLDLSVKNKKKEIKRKRSLKQHTIKESLFVCCVFHRDTYFAGTVNANCHLSYSDLNKFRYESFTAILGSVFNSVN